MAKMMTIKAFAKRLGIEMDCTEVGENPNMSGMPRGSRHYECVLRRGEDTGDAVTITYSMGPALEREPEVEDVLGCLAMDASTYLNARSFEEWAGELGFDADSRKAERTYQAVGKQVSDLEGLIGKGGVQELAFHTEPL